VIDARDTRSTETVETPGRAPRLLDESSSTLPAAAELPSVNLEFRIQTGCHERICHERTAGEHRLDACARDMDDAMTTSFEGDEMVRRRWPT